MGRRSKIFISYRRDDARDAAGRVYDRLAQKFGAKRLFMDVDSIQRGHDFRKVLETHLSETAVLLVLIGERWLEPAGPDGARRIDDPADFVRLEIATALRDDIPVIPVLLENAVMPGAAALPEDISGLAYRQASNLRHASFRTDILDLQAAVKDALGGARAGARSGGLSIGRIVGAVSLVSLAVGGVFAFQEYQRLELETSIAAEEAAARQRALEAEARRVEAEARKKATRTSFADRLQALPQGESLKECDACPEMVAIPGGSFTMGSPKSEPEHRDNEGPQRRVTIQPFAMGKFEVTFDEWDVCVADGGCRGYRPKDEAFGRGDRPVINVSWQDAQAYVTWLNKKVGGAPYRLPSEAEWEYAARAAKTTPFWWGRSITPSQANYDGNFVYEGGGSKGRYRKKTVPVESFAANPFGLYQVHGNVWEWAEDCWNESYSGAPSDGSAWRSGDCFRAVLRGGSWNYFPQYLRSAYRLRFLRVTRFNNFGFRVARTHRE